MPWVSAALAALRSQCRAVDQPVANNGQLHQ
jgi:hypothetical protein